MSDRPKTLRDGGRGHLDEIILSGTMSVAMTVVGTACHRLSGGDPVKRDARFGGHAA